MNLFLIPKHRLLKQVLISCWLLWLPVFLFSQSPDSILKKLPDSLIVKDSTLRADTSSKQSSDSVAQARPKDSIHDYMVTLDRVFDSSLYFDSIPPAIAIPMRLKSHSSDNLLFYILFVITAALAFFRFFYTRYFNTLFRVFFNTTLRQSQLTDQLLQAKLASLLFNTLFVVAGGLYTYLLLVYFKLLSPTHSIIFNLMSCTIGLAAIYAAKYLTLKFTGWITHQQDVTNDYVFIIFLINKIMGILLIPFTIVMAFSEPIIRQGAVWTSLLLIGLMFLMRFFRSYGLLQHRVKVSRFHFFLYIIGVEILPILLIYKTLLLILSKNL
ncbi:MAG: hypothetical protein RLY16_1571 [Bacteroidota bacterium]|jgi:hypothetical protein